MKKRFKTCAAIAMAAITFSLCSVPALADSKNFVINTEGSALPIPETYTVTKVIKSLDATEYSKKLAADSEGGESANVKVGFNQPQDIFIDKRDYIYVADTENNRVVKLDNNGKIILEITSAFEDGSGNPLALSKPRGVFVENGETEAEDIIWIADTGNKRIVGLTANGENYLEYGKPNQLNSARAKTFDVEKIYKNDKGYMFALKGDSLMKIDENNVFQGMIGTAEVEFSFMRFVVKTFGTQAQIKSLEEGRAIPYSNFMIAKDGNTYGVLSEGSDQIRRLNSTGDNNYPSGSYGYANYYDVNSADPYTPIEPRFVDVTANERGIVSVLCGDTGLIYQYDKEGNLLAAFGGKGEKKGTFETPTSLALDSKERIYVLDGTGANIQIFEPTQFIELVHEAINHQLDGEYSEAQEKWEQILKIDSGYFLAHKGIGKIQYREEDYSAAMDSYELAEDKTGYSEAFSEARHEIFRNYFFWLIVVIVLIIFGIGKLFVTIKRRADKWAFNIEMKGEL